MPYGTVTEHGTMFVGFAPSSARSRRCSTAWPGSDGPRDELTRYTSPLTGAYYFVPSLPALRTFATRPDED